MLSIKDGEALTRALTSPIAIANSLQFNRDR